MCKIDIDSRSFQMFQDVILRRSIRFRFQKIPHLAEFIDFIPVHYGISGFHAFKDAFHLRTWSMTENGSIEFST